MVVDKITDVLKKSRCPLILPHIDADGDCLGSSLALSLVLRKMGSNPVICLEEEMPDMYKFLPGRDMITVYREGRDFHSDLVIAVDVGDVQRLGERAVYFRDAKITVNIDHHVTNTFFADINDVRPGYSSVGEIMVDIIDELGTGFDRDTAECLYVAIAFDTGGFRYGNTTSGTHIAASRLLGTGIDVAGISRKIFETVSYEKVMLTGEVAGTIRLVCGKRVCVMRITHEMMKKTGASEEDCEGIINIGRSIRGVEVAVLLREHGNGIKANLRSNEFVDVAEIASMFGGGGHQRAAGFFLDGDIDAVEEKVIGALSGRVCEGK
jgi:phosphoesterase RecJ-like protein